MAKKGTAVKRGKCTDSADDTRLSHHRRERVGYSSNAERECAAFHKRTGRIIKLLTVQEILDDEHVQKM